VQEAKTALSEVILEVAPNVSKDAATKTILPVIVKLLESETADMRLNVLDKLAMLAESIGIQEVISQIVPRILPMQKDPKWRVRRALIESICTILSKVDVTVFESAYVGLVIEGLKDNVYGVREMAAKQVANLCHAYGAQWGIHRLLPEAMKANDDARNYLHRMVPVVLIYEALSHSQLVLPTDYLLDALLPIVFRFTKDPVANVRIYAVRLLPLIAKKMDQATVGSRIKPQLTELSSDADNEVKYSSLKVLRAIS